MIHVLAALSLLAAGMVNFFAGFMGLFPGLLEVAAADPESDETAVGAIELLGTPYGRYALAHLAGAGLQLIGGSWLSLLMRGPLLHGVALLCAVSLGLEAWGWALKGALSLWAVPGAVAGVLTGTLYGLELRSRATRGEVDVTP